LRVSFINAGEICAEFCHRTAYSAQKSVTIVTGYEEVLLSGLLH